MTADTQGAFDRRDEGTPEAKWVAHEQWQTMAGLDLSDVDRLLVLSAHPDDETLATAGLLLAARRLGIVTELLVATDGEKSHPGSPTLSPEQLARTRRTEVTVAAEHLAPGMPRTHLELPDGGLGDHEEAIVEVLCRTLASHENPERTLICAPWRHDGHGDHEAAGRAASVAAARTGCQLVEYPIWLWHWGGEAQVPWGQARRLDLDEDDRRRKREAIHLHRTQLVPLSEAVEDSAVLDSRFLAHFLRDRETFFVSEPEVAADVFESVHSSSVDPWGVDYRWYEQRKRALTIASLPRRRFSSALEIGCSVGALTGDLAERCDRLLAVDASALAVRSSKERLGGHAGVEVRRLVIPADWPEGRFDLIVMSESGYFLTPLQLETTVQRIAGSLTSDGVMVACHWRHPLRGWPLDGEIVHERMISGFAEHSMEMLAMHLEPDFVLHVFGAHPSVLPDPQEQP